MEIVKAVVLGVVQGVTEFLPISSSGHLVIGGRLLGFEHQGVTFEVFLHLGTLLAVLLVLRHEVLAMIRAPFAYYGGKRDQQTTLYWRWVVSVVIATLPAVVVGLFFKDTLEQLFDNIFVVYCMLTLTGIIMIITRFLPERDEDISGLRALLIGCAQACAILPGLSRSGSTIFAGMVLGVDREKMARFSFIMSIPAILGASVLQFGDMLAHPLPAGALVNIGVGTIASAISGYFSIKFLLDVIKKNRLQWFGYYCLLLAAVGLASHFFF